MAFSSIKNNPFCKCGCGKYKKLSMAGYATLDCMPEKLRSLEKYQSKSNVANASRAKRLEISKKVHTAQNEVLGQETLKNRQELEQWFDNISRLIGRHPFCMECNAFVPSKFYRHATAHIFPKSIFESVATHPMNYLILGAGCGCHDKTHRLDTFSDMKIFGEAVRRFRLFEKSITEKHKYLSAFREYADGNQ